MKKITITERTARILAVGISQLLLCANKGLPSYKDYENALSELETILTPNPND